MAICSGVFCCSVSLVGGVASSCISLSSVLLIRKTNSKKLAILFNGGSARS